MAVKPEKILSGLDKTQLKPLYLVTGEPFYQRAFISRLKHLLLHTDMDDYNHEKLDGEQLEIRDILRRAESAPLFGAQRLLVISRAPFFGKKMSDKDKNAFLDYLANPCQTTVLVFCADTIDKKLKPVKEVKKRDMLIEFSELKPWEMDHWITSRVRTMGYKIDPKAVATLIERTGSHLNLLEQELDKLFAYIGKKEIIMSEDIEAVVPPSAETNVFHLVDCIGEKQLSQAMSRLQELSHKEAPVKILFMIARQFRLLIKMKQRLTEGESVENASKNLKIHPFVGKKLASQSKNFTDGELSRALRLVQKIDYKMKTGQIDANFALTRLIFSLSEELVIS